MVDNMIIENNTDIAVEQSQNPGYFQQLRTEMRQIPEERLAQKISGTTKHFEVTEMLEARNNLYSLLSKARRGTRLSQLQLLDTLDHLELNGMLEEVGNRLRLRGSREGHAQVVDRFFDLQVAANKAGYAPTRHSFEFDDELVSAHATLSSFMARNHINNWESLFGVLRWFELARKL